MTTTNPCRCDGLALIEGEAASAYARGHLRLEGVAPDARSATWVCPASGWHWCEVYFSAWRSDEPSARLDRLDRAPAQPTGRPSRRLPWRPVTVVVMAALGMVTLTDLAIT